MDGMELLYQIRARHRFGLLIVTGRADTSDRVMGLELGADDYVVKPFEPRELIARVRSILRRYQPEHSPPADGSPKIASFAGWQFELGTLRLIAPDGKEDTLGARRGSAPDDIAGAPEPDTLSRPAAAGPRGDRTGSQYRSESSRLRRRLEENPQHAKIIKTVYGAGYLLATTVTWH